MYQTQPSSSAKELLPTMYDLPSEDPEEPGLPDEFHDFQPELLRQTFRPPHYPSDQVFVASDLNLYYDPDQTKWYKRPDWFAVLGVSRLYQQRDLRLSYVIWQEEIVPLIVVELLSPGTEAEDLGQTLPQASQPPSKWQVYERILGIPYYVVFNRYTDEWQAFRLVAGRYQPLNISPQGLWLPEAQLGLGLWRGTHQGINRLWLRWYDAFGNWIATPEEQECQRAEQERVRAQQAEQRAEQERVRAQQAEQRAEQERVRAQQAEGRAQRLAERIRAMGLNLEDDEL